MNNYERKRRSVSIFTRAAFICRQAGSHTCDTATLIKCSSTVNIFGVAWKTANFTIHFIPKGQQISTVKLSHVRSINLANEPNRRQRVKKNNAFLWRIPPAWNLTLHISLFNFAKLRNYNAMLFTFLMSFLCVFFSRVIRLLTKRCDAIRYAIITKSDVSGFCGTWAPYLQLSLLFCCISLHFERNTLDCFNASEYS